MKSLILIATTMVTLTMVACNNGQTTTGTTTTTVATADSTKTTSGTASDSSIVAELNGAATDSPSRSITSGAKIAEAKPVTGSVKTTLQAIVYKTKADYSKNVPVTLSSDKSKIVAYPAPGDVYYQGKPAYPTVLKDGYLLDNRGIGPNTAFLKLTYEEYAKLKTVPPLADLYNQIIDKDPFVEIYNLGNRTGSKDDAVEINAIIAKGGLKKFTKIK